MDTITPEANPNEWCRADTLQLVEVFAKRHGMDWEAVAARFGFAPTIAREEGSTIAFATFLSVFEYVAAVTGDDADMLDIGADMPVGLVSTFDYLALCAPSLRVALANWERFLPLRTNCYRMLFREDGDFGILEWDVADRFGPRTQNTFARVAWAASRILHAAGDQDIGLRIEFSAARPKKWSQFQKRMGERIAFQQPVDRILIPARHLSLRPRQNEPNLYSIIEQAAIHELGSRTGEAEPLAKVAETINESLKAGTVSLETVASTLGMSPRSLQRLLETEGTSFRKLTESIRRSMAARYLRDTRLPMKEIAFLLGFSELSAFSRAVKTWYGVPPKSIRLFGIGGPTRQDG
ncbi:helix-turn-helix transcriptional regulator [Polymorphum gilvum]|uniref:AraC-type DNA-binding domain-containing protein n=1 Tax=Polymorphum gilvum (strain LMG 25793 / CGMCC 1.9160 / SL003B-26A1) TaxID=991905 RepID=F2IY62_POLGS|nr:AraC family transcriptional regulator [Polymorphum gilvum]ADZ71674.1 AraC-type DNA-binding domain-containing protein [Polymorphum gilvum SL003B-26A1]